jgi:hypothetical protein
MAKFTIPLKNLPPPDKNGNHLLRFRVTTEDRNSISEWSKIFKVESLGQIDPEQVESNVTALTENGPFEITWKGDVITSVSSEVSTVNESQQYDIFVKWDIDPFYYFGRVTGNKVVVYKEPTASSMRVVGHLPVHPAPEQSSVRFQIFDTGTVVL